MIIYSYKYIKKFNMDSFKSSENLNIYLFELYHFFFSDSANDPIVTTTQNRLDKNLNH